MENTQSRAFELVIIGGGTAGLTALSEALALGVNSVALIEQREELGGECALNACVPVDTMLTAARILKTIKAYAAEYGVMTDPPHLDFQKLMAKVNAVVHDGEPPVAEDFRVTLIRSEASFISRKELQVGDTAIRAERFIIATGSQTKKPEITGLEAVGFLTYPQATHLPALPKSLIILGGYRLAVEFAQLFQWLGCRVTLVQEQLQLLPEEEPEISAAIEAILLQEGVRLYTGCDFKKSQFELLDGRKVLHTEWHGQQLAVEAEQVLLMTGLKPRLDGLGLENTGVRWDENGIIVDGTFRTQTDNIWAVGDVVGPWRFTHVADREATLAVHNALENRQDRLDTRALSWAIFTDPPIAHVGLTEGEARKCYPNTVVVTTQATEASRYRIESRTQGFIKLIIDGDSDRLVGAHLLAEHSTDIAHMLMLAIQFEMTVAQVLTPIPIYPSMAQIVQKALEAYPQAKQSQLAGKAKPKVEKQPAQRW